MAELFNVVFAGELVGRADPAAVRANVGKLFGASEAVLDKLFSGQPVAIKKGIDRATAMQLRARMKQAGAETRLVQVDEQGQPVAGAAGAIPAAPRPVTPAPAVAAAGPVVAPAMPRPAPVSPAAAGGATAATRPVAAAAPAQPAAVASAPAAAPAPAAGSMAERLAALAREEAAVAEARAAAAPPAAATGNWDVNPVGTRLSTPLPPPPLAPDVSAISLAAATGNLVSPQELARPAPVQVDISSLSMAPPNTEVLRDDERPQVVPVQVDLSGMSVAEVGAPLDEIREDKPLLNPDTSYIKLVD